MLLNGLQRKPLRTDFLVEYHGEGTDPSTTPLPCVQPNMACGIVGPEMDMHPPMWNKAPICSCQDSHNNTYACVRTLEPVAGGRDWTYCEFFTMEGVELSREFYNITADYWQRKNEVGGRVWEAGDRGKGVYTSCVS